MIHKKEYLEANEYRLLHKKAKSQEEIIAHYFRTNSHLKFNFAEIMQTFGMDKDSCKRSISNLSNVKPSAPYLDQNGFAPLTKLAEKRTNSLTGIKCSLYQWNTLYGKKLKSNQTVMFL